MRQHDWMLRFDALVKGRHRSAYRWGEHDCCMWAADCVEAVTGHDPASAFRGAYTDEDGAAAVLAAHGGIAGLASRLLGPSVDPRFACTGDVGLMVPLDGGGSALCVCAGEHWLAAGVRGLSVVPLEAVERAWRCEVQ